MKLAPGVSESSEHPGWYTWGGVPAGSFAAAIGQMVFRPEGDGRTRCRMFPTPAMLNMGGSIHGGAVMSFIDMALFAGGRMCGMAAGHYVTLDCATHFIARSRAGTPLDALISLVAQTKGGHVFLSGHCEQDGETTHSFTGTLKRIRDKT